MQTFPAELSSTLPFSHPLLFATVSGAHLYGFPSPDSDIDVRGSFVLQTGEIEANLRLLNAHFHLPDIDDLIARKITEGAPLTEGEAEAHRPRIDELLSRLDGAFEKSALPEKPANFAALNEFVIRVRKEIS